MVMSSLKLFRSARCSHASVDVRVLGCAHRCVCHPAQVGQTEVKWEKKLREKQKGRKRGDKVEGGEREERMERKQREREGI